MVAEKKVYGSLLMSCAVKMFKYKWKLVSVLIYKKVGTKTTQVLIRFIKKDVPWGLKKR